MTGQNMTIETTRIGKTNMEETMTKEETNLEKTIAFSFAAYGGTKCCKVPLCNLFIPGTHDSGAYELNVKMGFAIDRPDMRDSILYRWFYFLLSPIVHRFSLTQNGNILEQLERGARYLDLRIGLRPEDKQFYIVHNLYGPRIEVVLQQIATYIAKHPREIVILDFQHLHGFQTNSDHERLKSLLAEFLDASRIIPPACVAEARQLTLERIWELEKQLMIVYRHPYQEDVQAQSWYCHASLLPNPWPNTTDPEVLSSFMQRNIHQRMQTNDKLAMFVTQAVLTPHTLFVIANFYSDLRTLLVPKSNETICKWIDSFQDRKLNQQQIKSSPCKAFGPNIIMLDHLGTCEQDISLMCHQLNLRYFHHQSFDFLDFDQL